MVIILGLVLAEGLVVVVLVKPPGVAVVVAVPVFTVGLVLGLL
jgi:hypothetical protein